MTPERRAGLRSAIPALGSALLGLWIAASAAAQEAEQPRPPAPEPLAIALPDVVKRADDVEGRLRELAARLGAGSEVAEVERALPSLAGSLDDRVEETKAIIAEDVSMDFLGDVEMEWLSRREAVAGWIEALTDHATQLESDLAGLDALLAVWKETRETAREKAPPKLRARIDETVAAITAARAGTDRQLDRVLTLQTTASDQRERVVEAFEMVRAAREAALGDLFTAASPPVWSADFREALAADLGEGFSDAADAQVQTVAGWVEEEQGGPGFVLLAMLTVGLVLGLAAGRRRLRAAQEAGPGLEEAAPIFEHPVAAGLLLALLLAPALFPDAPRIVFQLFYAAVLVPAVLLLRRLAAPALHPLLYALVGFFFTDRVRQILEPLPAAERVVFLLQIAAGVGILVWLARPARLAQIPTEAARSRLLRSVGVAERIALALLVLALVAGSAGYVRMERLLGNAVFGSAYAAVVLYAVVRISSVLLHFVLRVAPLRHLGMAIRHRALLERRGDWLLRLAGYGTWAWATLNLLEIRDPLAESVRGVLGAEIPVGAVSLSPGDVLAFAITVWAAFLLSRFLRFVLEEDVFPRARMQRGMPYAISTLLHYAVLLLGFLLAVAATGIDLDRIAFLAGAFGVGLGFGLQNVVNNFVSGLILLFERPIQRGDMIQTAEVWGEVKRIGIRASVVRTFDGAEVIVPNGHLISERVTNWTLSDTHRRVDVSVGVAYGTDPERVLAILEEVAAAHPDVLTTPPPVTLFEGFGDSALDFRLRAWIRDFDRGLSVRSELSVALDAALREAGIEIPFPQRDVHLRSPSGSD